MTDSRPLVCLVDPHDNGHHPMYAAAYAQAFRSLGCDVWLVVPHPLAALMPPVDDPAAVVVPWDIGQILADHDATPQARATRLWKRLAGVLDERSQASGRYPDLVVHLFVDSFISELLPKSAIDDSIRCPFAGLWFKPPERPGWGWRDVAKRIVRLGRRFRSLRSSRWAAILLLDTFESEHLLSHGRPKIVPMPEFSVTGLPEVEPQVVAEIRHRAAGRRICALVGSLEGRKGVKAFLRSAAAAPADEWFFVMAGKAVWETFDEEVRQSLARQTGEDDSRVLLVDGWLDDEILNAVVAVSGLLHVCYEHWPFSSNMLCKSAAFRVPAIGCDEGYLGRSIREYGLGLTVPSGEHMPARFVPGFAGEVAAFAGEGSFRDGCARYLAANQPAALAPALRSGLAGVIPFASDMQLHVGERGKGS